jgi:hypothetical protein
MSREISHKEVESGADGDRRMNMSGYTDEQINGIPKEQEAGVAELCCKRAM